MAKFHVDVFPDTTSKQGFPRSRACANQLYLPQYGSKEELHDKLHEACGVQNLRFPGKSKIAEGALVETFMETVRTYQNSIP